MKQNDIGRKLTRITH